MRQEHQLIGLGVILITGGLASLLVPDFDGAGWYAAAAGVVAILFSVWFLVRGGNVPHPPEVLPKLAAPTQVTGGCPKCGSGARPMTGAETTAFYGYDRFVLVRPRICLTCGHGFEVQPTRTGCYLMLAVTTLGVLFGLAFILGGVFVAWKGGSDEALDPIKRGELVLGGVGLCFIGVWWARRSWRIGAHYGRLLSRPPGS